MKIENSTLVLTAADARRLLKALPVFNIVFDARRRGDISYNKRDPFYYDGLRSLSDLLEAADKLCGAGLFVTGPDGEYINNEAHNI